MMWLRKGKNVFLLNNLFLSPVERNPKLSSRLTLTLRPIDICCPEGASDLSVATPCFSFENSAEVAAKQVRCSAAFVNCCCVGNTLSVNFVLSGSLFQNNNGHVLQNGILMAERLCLIIIIVGVIDHWSSLNDSAHFHLLQIFQNWPEVFVNHICTKLATQCYFWNLSSSSTCCFGDGSGYGSFGTN